MTDARKVVLHVILSMEIGGMEQVVADLVLNLDPVRFRPVVVCLHSLGPLAGELRGKGVTVILLGPMAPVFSYFLPYRLIRLIKELQADIVHVHSGCWHKAAMAGFLTGTRVICTDHGRTFPDSKKIILLDRIFSRITDSVVCVSPNLAEYMVATVGIPENKVLCILNGIDVDRFEDARQPQRDVADRLGIIARLAPVKDVGSLVQALKILHEKGHRASLAVVGDGPDKVMLQQMVELLGLGSSVTFHGFMRSVETVLADMDIFVLCSLSEGTSITLLEAMAAGKPVVVTNVGGNPAIVRDEINGCLVPPRDPQSLAAALARLMGDREKREQMSAVNVRAVRENYGVGSMTRAYEKLYGQP